MLGRSCRVRCRLGYFFASSIDTIPRPLPTSQTVVPLGKSFQGNSENSEMGIVGDCLGDRSQVQSIRLMTPSRPVILDRPPIARWNCYDANYD